MAHSKEIEICSSSFQSFQLKPSGLNRKNGFYFLSPKNTLTIPTALLSPKINPWVK
jgi:hypothetical protein